MTRIFLLTLSLWLPVGESYAESQPPQQQKRESAKKQPDAAKRGTDDAPSAIKITPADNAKGETKGDTKKADANTDWPTLAIGFLQFIALVVTIIVMIRTGRNQMRAYVAIVSVTREHSHQGQDRPKFVVQFKNAGQTPAYDLAVWSGIAFKDVPIKGDIRVTEAGTSAREETKMVLWPDGEDRVERIRKESWTEAETAEMTTKRKAICFFGWIHYRDAFDRRQWTEFCYIATGKEGEHLGLKRHTHGNDAS